MANPDTAKATKTQYMKQLRIAASTYVVIPGDYHDSIIGMWILQFRKNISAWTIVTPSAKSASSGVFLDAKPSYNQTGDTRTPPKPTEATLKPWQ